jgi:hypothetical protein
MKAYDEIKDIIVNRLGLRDLAAYKIHCDQYARWENPKIPTEEEIELLSPDSIDNNAFWRVAEELFKTDPVSNCGNAEPVSVEEANRRNMVMYHLDGFAGMIEAVKVWRWWPNPRLLEIGPGYGAFKAWLTQTSPEWSYHAVDSYPRIEGVDATELNGRLATVTKERTYDVAVASNVFQHLSVAQRRAYYADLAQSLSNGGLFMVSSMVDCLPFTDPRRDANGRQWCRHYGQFTEIQKHPDIATDLQEHFRVIQSTVRDNSWATFLCQKKPVQPPAVSPAIL